MTTTRKRLAACFAGLLTLGLIVGAAPDASAHGKHPGRALRVKQCLRGDSRTTRSVAGHTTAFAIERFKIGDLVANGDVERAQREMYDLLKWKLGNPTAVCVTYVAHGYRHFERAYSDEAAAALLGFDLPNERGGRASFQLPPELVNLNLRLEQAMIPAAVAVLQALYGIPAAVGKPLLELYIREKHEFIGRLGINIPKRYDFPNGLVTMTIHAHRDLRGTRNRIQRAITKQASASGRGRKGTRIGKAERIGASGRVGLGRRSPIGVLVPGSRMRVSSSNASTGDVLGSDGRGREIAFKLARSQAQQVNRGQDLRLDGTRVRGTQFPIESSKRDRVRKKRSWWMQTSLRLSNNGRLEARTRTWTKECMRGFTGGVAVFLYDADGNSLWNSQLHRYGVNGECLTEPHRRDELWSETVPEDQLNKVAKVAIVQKYSPKNRFDDFVRDAKKLAEVVKEFVAIYKEVKGGGTGASSGDADSAASTGSKSAPAKKALGVRTMKKQGKFRRGNR